MLNNRPRMPHTDLPKHARSEFQIWYYSLTHKERLRFAKRCNLTINHIGINYMRPIKKPFKDHIKYKKPCRVQPKTKRMMSLTKGAKGILGPLGVVITLEIVRDHFYPL